MQIKKDYENLENLLCSLVTEKIGKEAKRYMYQKIKEVAKKEFGLEINKEYLVFLTMRNNRYYKLLQQKKEIIRAKSKNEALQQRSNSARLEHSNVMKHREAIDKIIKRELTAINQQIRNMKQELDISFIRYCNVYNRIYSMTKYIHNPIYYDISNRKEKTIEAIRTNTVDVIGNKRIERKYAKMQDCPYSKYIVSRTEANANKDAIQIKHNVITKKKMDKEYMEQYDNEQTRNNILTEKLVSSVNKLFQ